MSGPLGGIFFDSHCISKNTTKTITQQTRSILQIHAADTRHSLPVEFVDTVDEARTHLVNANTVTIDTGN